MTLPLSERLARVLGKKERFGLGLLSGTSADAVDAALVRFGDDGEKPRLLGYRSVPLPEDVRRQILSAETARLDSLVDLHYRLGHLFADAARAVSSDCGVEPDFVGTHGQTIFHRSRQPGREAATLQIGEPSIIAARTRAITVADFRPSDIAAGGDGAPLVPLLDRALFACDGVPRCIVNLGGIANLTALDGRAGGAMIAFDSGPANMPIDLAMRALSGGTKTFDADGRTALAGRCDDDLLARLLAHPYLAREAPKSTGAQEFGADFVSAFLRENTGRDPSTLVATLTHFSASALERAYRREVAGRIAVKEVVLCGGGVHNPALVAAISERFAPIRVVTTAAHGIDPDAKEAILFAFLAHETLLGRTGNVTAATGAVRGAILGKVVFP